MRNTIFVLAALSLLGACAVAPASHKPEVQQNDAANRIMDHKSDFFVARKGIEDGYVVIFHVMPAPEGEDYSRTYYHLMVSIEKNGQPVTGLKVYSDVKHPDGEILKKSLMMQMGDWYMARYNLSHEQGRHWLTVSFKLNGHDYFSSIYYPERIVR